jgi:hypothetical protein
MPSESKVVSGLVTDIYDAALDPSLWVSVLEQACEFVRGAASGLFAKDPADRTGDMYYALGDDPHYRELYFHKYVKCDPFTTAQFFLMSTT